MRKHRVLLQIIVGSLAPFGLTAMAMAAGPDVIVTDAKIEAGKLVITGKTAAGSTRVRLDGRSEAEFNTLSGGDRTFRFGLVYLPKDCIVSLQKVHGSQLGAGTDAVIANCSPSAITPRGVWSEKTSYEALDLVSHGGASWLANRGKAKGQPGKSRDWQLFAGAVDSETGGAGKSGSKGPDGSAPATGTVVNPQASPTGAAGGDLTGTYPNPQIATGAVTSAKIVAKAVTTAKLKEAAVTTVKIADSAVTELKLADGAVTANKIVDGTITAAKIALGTITGAQIANETITAANLATDSVNATEIANDSIDAGEIIDFGLSNEDVGVLFAQVNGDGTLASSSGGVTSSKIGTGTYEVVFGHVISACAYVMTQGEAGVGGAGGGITGATDRAGNTSAVFATMRTDANVLVDRAFQLVVVC